MQTPTIARMPTPPLASPALPGQPQYIITDDDRKRQQRIKLAWEAYDGELPEPLKKMPDGTNNNVRTNPIKGVVDQGVNFLFGKELEIAVAEDAPKVAQDILDGVWGRKEARIPLLQKLAMNGAMAGEMFLRISPSKNGTFRLVVVDPSIVFVKTAPQDCETVLLYCIEYSEDETDDMGRPQRISYREEIARVDPHPDDANDGYEDSNADGLDADISWSIGHWSRKGDRGPWTAAGPPLTWPYPFAPLFSRQNLPRPNDFWGGADVTADLIGVNKALNLVESDIAQCLWFYGNPIIYGTGVGESSIDIRPGRIVQLPLPESKLAAVAMHTEIANALTFAADLRSDIDAQSGVPGVAIGRIATMPRGNLSGIAIELLFMPLLKKTEVKRNNYGELIIDVSKALLVLSGITEDVDIDLPWQSPIPHDDLGAVQAAIAKKEISISNTTLQRELGYDPEEELKLTQTEDAQKLAHAQQVAASLPFAIPGTKPLPGQLPQPPAQAPGQPAQQQQQQQPSGGSQS